jgi:hypothetical protein
LNYVIRCEPWDIRAGGLLLEDNFYNFPIEYLPVIQDTAEAGHDGECTVRVALTMKMGYFKANSVKEIVPSLFSDSYKEDWKGFTRAADLSTLLKLGPAMRMSAMGLGMLLLSLTYEQDAAVEAVRLLWSEACEDKHGGF